MKLGSYILGGVLGLAAVAALIFVTGLFEPEPGAPVPLPTLPPEDPAVLRVTVIENGDLPSFSGPEWQIVLSTAQSAAQSHFGVDIAFAEPVRLDLAEVFARLDRAMPDAVKARIAPYRTDRMNWRRMVGMVEATLPETEVGLDGALGYLEDHAGRALGPLPGDAVEQRRALAEAAVDVLRENLARSSADLPEALHGAAARAGKPGYNEWVYWDALPSLDLPYDVYLTNQGVISVEYARYPLHIIARSGITAGTTSGSAEGRYGAASWVTAFPFLDGSDFVRDLRGGRDYSRTEAAEYAGLLLAHELGHLLLHLEHPWGNPACVMRPTDILKFAEAAESLDPAACPLGSGPAMTPGAAYIPGPEFFE